MENQLKLLITPECLHDMKATSIALEKYSKEVLIPLKDSVSGEIRRSINIHRKIEVAIKETDRMLSAVKQCLGEE